MASLFPLLQRRDNPLYSPSSSGTAMPASPKASPVPLTPVFGRHQAADSEAADGVSGYSAAGAQANAFGSQVSAAEERQASAPCGQAACAARLAQLTQLLDMRAEEAAVMQVRTVTPSRCCACAATSSGCGACEASQACANLRRGKAGAVSHLASAQRPAMPEAPPAGSFGVG